MPDPTSNIQAFIEQQRAAGAFDSSGAFTVDLRKARDKLSVFEEATPGYHGLRLVQAGVLLGAGAIFLEHERAVLTSEEDTLMKIPVRDLLQSLHQPQDIKHPGHRCLVSALRACLAISDQVVIFQQKGRLIESTAVTLDGIILGEPLNSMDGHLLVQFPRAKMKAEVLAAAHHTYHRRCGYATAEVSLERRSLTSAYNEYGYAARPPRLALWNSYTDPSYLLAWRHEHKRRGSGFRIPRKYEVLSQLPGRQDNHSVFLYERNVPDKPLADREIAIPLALEGPGEVKLIWGGVVLETVEVDLGVPGARATACVDQLDTDLSGLRVVQGPAFEALVQELRQETLQLAIRAREQLVQFRLPKPPDESPGLVAKLINWAFSLEFDDDDADHQARESECRAAVAERLSRL